MSNPMPQDRADATEVTHRISILEMIFFVCHAPLPYGKLTLYQQPPQIAIKLEFSLPESFTPLKMMKILLIFFESNKFRQFFFFSIKIALNSCYLWKNFSFFPLLDEFPLISVIKTIYSAFRGN
jgi:hypothetical protein